MSLSTIRTTVSLFTLNALLQIYENQPMEFYESSHMIQHPKLTPMFQCNQYFNLLSGLLNIIIADRSNKINSISSLLVGASVIIQNLNFFLPKTFNMIWIYFQMIVLIHQIFLILSYFYERLPQKVHQSPKDYVKEQKPAKKQNMKKLSQNKKKEKTITKEEKVEPITQIQPIENTVSEYNDDKSIENDFGEFMKQPSNDLTVTEIETEAENQQYINHVDLSQMSSTKEEIKLQFQVKFSQDYQIITCTIDTFDSTFTQLNTVYTNDQVKQIKTHLLLNMYDTNEDCTCRLWCLKKLLSLQC